MNPDVKPPKSGTGRQGIHTTQGLATAKDAVRPLLLIILDGWGHRPERSSNAIATARTPTFDWLEHHASKTILKSAGRDVGLPDGYQGNSEVGHLNLGAGRIVKEMMTVIDDAIASKGFYSNPALASAINACRGHNSSLHIMGLVQDEGVHALTRHAIALLKLAKQQRIAKVWLHIFTDGRDTPPQSARGYVRDLLLHAKRLKTGTAATLMGRYFAMDRDRRWKRTKKAFEALTSANGLPEPNPLCAIRHAYQQGQTDEFILPRIFPGYCGIKPHDAVIFFNYRLDRARQLTHALNDARFTPFPRPGLPMHTGKPAIHFVGMTRYYEEMTCPVAFEHAPLKNLLGAVLSKHRIRQLRIAETEKYAHVTYFFNGEEENPFPGEDRILIPSPKVATYDLKPEMSAHEITHAALAAIAKARHQVIIMNFANGDMVGHTGSIPAARKAVETVDSCVKRLLAAVQKKRGTTIITADHGNCEDMQGRFQTSHTLNPVPLYLIAPPHPRGRPIKLRKGRLADVAPTILKWLGIPKPKEMTGKALF